jgi:hypothetical protein
MSVNGERALFGFGTGGEGDSATLLVSLKTFIKLSNTISVLHIKLMFVKIIHYFYKTGNEKEA